MKHPVLAGLATAVLFSLASPALSEAPGTDLRLYTLDCGTLALDDMGIFSDTGEHAGEAGVMAVPCFLVRRGDDWLLWDAGLGDRLAVIPGGVHQLGGQWTVRRTLAAQLQDLGLAPADIAYVALSHAHADHSGNIDLFPDATWLMDPVELSAARAEPTPLGVDRGLLKVLDTASIRPIEGDMDVFGDGRVLILKTPGHTAGHKSLLVRLRNSGPVLLTGDLFHTRENRAYRRVPSPNVDRADTLASFDRFEGVAARESARVIVQHSPQDVATLPAPPFWLD